MKLSSELNQSVPNLQQTFTNFIQFEHSQDFYESGEDNSYSNVIAKNDEIFKKLKEISSDKNIEKYELIPYIEQCFNLNSKFEKNFKTTVQSISEIGNIENGNISELEFASEETEKKISEFGNYTEKNLFYELKQIENNFFTFQTPEILNEFSLNAKSLADEIAGSTDDVSIYGKRQVADAFSKYFHTFEVLANLYIKTGMKNSSGLTGKSRQIVDEFKSNTEFINTTIFQRIINETDKIYNQIIFVVIIMILLLLIISFLFASKAYNNIKIILNKLSSLAYGSIPSIFKINSKDEFSDISNSINSISTNLTEKKEFILKIGNYEFSHKVPMTGDSDELGNSLLFMQKKLIEKEDSILIEKKHKDSQEKHVAGLAKFGDILRRHTDNIEKLSFEVISNLVSFFDALIGGIYIYGDDKKLLLTAAYAFNEKKILQKEILEGEGLIGTCAIEKSTFYFDKLPENYVKLTTGFGKVTPNTLLICPLILTEKVYGVIEIASLNEFTKFDIDFLEALGEDIASTISYMKVNLKTSFLLKEMQIKADEAAKREKDLNEEIMILKSKLNIN